MAHVVSDPGKSGPLARPPWSHQKSKPYTRAGSNAVVCNTSFSESPLPHHESLGRLRAHQRCNPGCDTTCGRLCGLVWQLVQSRAQAPLQSWRHHTSSPTGIGIPECQHKWTCCKPGTACLHGFTPEVMQTQRLVVTSYTGVSQTLCSAGISTDVAADISG